MAFDLGKTFQIIQLAWAIGQKVAQADLDHNGKLDGKELKILGVKLVPEILAILRLIAPKLNLGKIKGQEEGFSAALLAVIEEYTD